MFNLSIKTTQNIPLFFTPASFSERLLAFLIDFMIQSGYLILVFVFLELDEIYHYSDQWSLIAVIALLSAPATLYPVVCEMFMSGQTFGKKVMQIRVIKIDGYQASFGDYIIRWLFALVEVYTIGGIALVSMLTSKYTQRLGDFASGTAVITEKNKTHISHSILMEVEQEYVPYFSHSEVFAFSDDDARVIKQYFTEAQNKQNWEIIGKLSTKIEQVSGKNNTLVPIEFVERFLKDYNYHTTKNQ